VAKPQISPTRKLDHLVGQNGVEDLQPQQLYLKEGRTREKHLHRSHTNPLMMPLMIRLMLIPKVKQPSR